MRVSAAVHGPDAAEAREHPVALRRRRAPRRRRATIVAPRRADSTTVRDCGGSSPARCHAHDGTCRQPSIDGGANIGRGVGPGARSPNHVTMRRHAPNACMPVTFCSKIELARASKTRSVRLSRRPGLRRCASATSGCRDPSKSPGVVERAAQGGELAERPVGARDPTPRRGSRRDASRAARASRRPPGCGWPAR